MSRDNNYKHVSHSCRKHSYVLCSLFYVVCCLFHVLCSMLSEGEHFFIDAETKLHKVAPVEWKGQSKKGYRQTATFTTYFHIKFFVDDLSLLRYIVFK